MEQFYSSTSVFLKCSNITMNYKLIQSYILIVIQRSMGQQHNATNNQMKSRDYDTRVYTLWHLDRPESINPTKPTTYI